MPWPLQDSTSTQKGIFFEGDSDYKIAIRLALWWEVVLTVKPAHALRLFHVNNRIFSCKRASNDDVRQILGVWAFSLLLRRPAASILSASFQCLETGSSEGSLTGLQEASSRCFCGEIGCASRYLPAPYGGSTAATIDSSLFVGRLSDSFWCQIC